MGYNASRLTAYAILSSAEKDLRKLVVHFLGDQKPAKEIMDPQLLERCENRFHKDVGEFIKNPSLEELILYVDFGDTFQILNANKALLPSAVVQYLKSITKDIEKLIPIRNRVAHVRPLLFDDLAATLDVTKRLLASDPARWVHLKETFHEIESNPGVVLSIEIPNYLLDQDNVSHNLPIPDFDETGFVGRKDQAEQLINLCKGPYPVITIVGEGGLGKTALALKSAYDLLDMEPCPYDAIVWTTSKTSQITAKDIVEIEGAIKDSIGLFSSVSEELSGMVVGDPVDEILEYLKHLRVFLILDNLETVLDVRIRKFLEHLPVGSKVLITSRIGLGAYEYPIKLEQMSGGDAVQLLRALARARGLNGLTAITNAKLERYCQRMKFNPGFIKWFVSAVQAGKRPEEVLQNPDKFLEFCMSNVYEYLSDESRRLLHAMQCLPGRHSQAEMHFLSGLEDTLLLQRALQELLATNMVFMQSIPRGSSYESKYEIGELARSYLSKHHPPSSGEQKKYQKKKRQLIEAKESVKRKLVGNEYDINTLSPRSSSDLIVAKYLVDALRKTKRKEFAEADQFIAKAKKLAPEYSDVHRVEAFSRSLQEDLSGADSAYEAAIELAPTSAPLRLWYGGFLLRKLDDLERARIHLEEGLRLDNSSFDLKIELARLSVYSAEWKEAERYIVDILEEKNLTVWQKKRVYDLYFQLNYRRAESLYEQHDLVGAVDEIIGSVNLLKGRDNRLRDDRMNMQLKKQLRVLQLCIRNLRDLESSAKAIKTARFLMHELGERGTVIEPASDHTNGVVMGISGNRFEYHSGNLMLTEESEKIIGGSEIWFTTINRKQGRAHLGQLILHE